MRLTTVASIVVLSLSTAALAQVATAPTKQKIPTDNAASPDETTSGSNAVSVANDIDAASPGAPSTALVNSAADTPGKPSR